MINVGKSEPTVSVFIPTYNQQDFIEEALHSVFSQKVDFALEIIVVDDCSTDKTLSVVKETLNDSPFPNRLVSNQRNLFSLGISPLMNSIRYLSGEFIARLDGDDFWISDEKLLKQVEFFRKNNEANLCCTLSKEFNNNTNTIRNLDFRNSDKKNEFQLIKYDELVRANFVVHSSAMFRKDSILNLPGDWNELVVRDYALWGYISDNNFIGLIPEFMIGHRIHQNNQWMSLDKWEKRLEELRAIMWLVENSSSFHARKLWSERALKEFSIVHNELSVANTENSNLNNKLSNIETSKTWKLLRLIARKHKRFK